MPKLQSSSYSGDEPQELSPDVPDTAGSHNSQINQFDRPHSSLK